MHHSPTVRRVAIAALLLLAQGLVAGCATSRLPPVSAAGSRFEPLPDERDLWARSRAEEEALLAEATVYDDPLLVDYLEGIVDRLNPPAMAANPEIRYRVTVIEDPTVNAFAYPHGSIFVHTGLLARMESEDELATVFGHEMSHVEGRHMLRFQRAARNRQIGLSVAAVTASVILAGEEADAYHHGRWHRGARIRLLSDLFFGLGLPLAVLAAVNGYGRDLELEADQDGFAKLAAAGYDPQAAPGVYEALLADHGEAPSPAEAFFFASHPKLVNRLESARAWAASQAPSGDAGKLSHGPDADPPPVATHGSGPDDFADRVRPVVRLDAEMNLEMGRLELAEEEIERVLRWEPEDPEGRLLLGRLRLAQAERVSDDGFRSTLEQEAEDALHEAVRLDPQLPEPHRELGLLAYRGGEYRAACREFRHYLDAAPDAPDAQAIADQLYDLEQNGWCPPTPR